jgi:hypothetical protein
MSASLDKNILKKQGNRKKCWIYQCNTCSFTCMYPAERERHISTSKHKKLTMCDSSVPNRYLYCKQCDVMCSGVSEYDIHITTHNHCNKVRDGPKKPSRIFYCEPCDVKCSSMTDYNRHLNTSKHACQIMENAEKSLEKTSVHVSTCPPENVVRESLNENMIMKCLETFMTAQAEQADRAEAQAVAVAEQAGRAEAQAVAAAEQTRLLIETISLSGPRSITNNTTNNNQFNLNVFLNEDCKDAYTLKEVMESIECTVTDLDRMDTDGYAATITRKILESMQHMSITERPIHCTDSRRNTVCVKDETGWEKNEKAMKRLVDSVYLVGRKLGRMVDDWRVAYPDHFRGTETRRNQYHRLITDILKVSDLEIEARIASKVCKGIVLDRKTVMER